MSPVVGTPEPLWSMAFHRYPSAVTAHPHPRRLAAAQSVSWQQLDGPLNISARAKANSTVTVEPGSPLSGSS